MHRVVKNLSLLAHMFPADTKEANTLCLFVSALTPLTSIHLPGLLNAIFFSFLCFFFFVSVLLFKMAPKCSAEKLSTVPKCKKAVMRVMEKTHVLDKLHSGSS